VEQRIEVLEGQQVAEHQCKGRVRCETRRIVGHVIVDASLVGGSEYRMLGNTQKGITCSPARRSHEHRAKVPHGPAPGVRIGIGAPQHVVPLCSG